MEIDEVVAILKRGEGQYAEFKTGFAEQNKAIESLCSFANAEGGIVVIGADDNGVVTGADIGRNTIENFANEITRHTNPPLTPTIEEVEIDGHMVTVASIEKIVDLSLQ